MIPILFEHSEKDFTSNGLGRLAEAASCKVTEELNGIYELELVYPVTGRHYEELTFGRIIYATHDDAKDPEPFDIYRKTAPLNGQVTVYARHISYRLNNIILEPYDAGSCTAIFAGISHHSINPNPFEFLNTVSGTADFELNHPVSVRELLCGTGPMDVPQLFGGDYEWKKFTVYHRAKRGRDTSIELRYGKNITDLAHDVNAGQTYGAVIPYWLSSDGMELAVLPEWMVINQGSTSERVGLLDLSHEWDVYPEEEDLRTYAAKALQDSNIPVESLTVSFYELWQTEEYEHFASLQRAFLGDDIKIVDPDLAINTTLRVVKVVYNVLLDRYDSMELGKASVPYASVIQQQVRDEIYEIAPTKSAMELAIEHATQLITGGLGGHLVIGTDENGNPNELLIMDTTDKATAVNVLRLNLNGIGFSTTGYDGPFDTAWTIDSHFVADFITTGNLNASLLTLGVLQSNDGNIRFDLEAGTFEAVLSSMKLISKATQEGEADVERTVEEVALDTVNLENVTNALTQMAVFNKLTNNGTIQGFFIDQESGEVYVNLSGLRADGFFKVEHPKTKKTVFYVNANTGEVEIFPTKLYITADQDIKQYIEDNAISDEDIIKVLTDNEQTEGMFISEGGHLYLSWSYAKGDVLKLGGSRNQNGVLEVYDSSGYQILGVGNDGLKVSTPQGWGKEYVHIKDGIIYGYADKTLKSYIDLIANYAGYEQLVVDATNCHGVVVKADYFTLTGEMYAASGVDATSLKTSGELRVGGESHLQDTVYLGNVRDLAKGLSTMYYFLTLDNYEVTLIGFVPSSKRYKHIYNEVTSKDVEDAYKIKVYMARYKDGVIKKGDQREGKTYPMFVAEQMYEHLPIAVDIKDGQIESWNVSVLIPVMFQMIKDQKEILDEQQKRIDDLEARLARLEKLVL